MIKHIYNEMAFDDIDF